MAAVPKEADPISDEEWLVFKAHECLKSDSHATKAWLMTAKSLFPGNFDIQLEAYNLEKESRNPPEVAKHLEEMFVTFPQEPRLWNEVTELVETLQSESVDDQTIFLQAVFAALPASLQCHLLVHIADTTTDILRQCRVMLVVLRRYPEHIPKRGVKLAESLLSVEKHSSFTSPVNRYRKYLVCDVLPLLLGCSQLQVSAKYLYRLLQKSIEFFVCYVTQPTSTPDQLTSPSPELKSPSKPVQSYGGSMFRRVSISGLSEKESSITHPWQRLFDLVKAVGRLLHWKVADLFETTSRQSQWQHVCTLYEGVGSHIDPGPHLKQVLYCATVLFFHCLLNYVAAVDPDQFIVTNGGVAASQPQEHQLQTVVLIEAFKSGSLDVRTEHRSKKQKMESMPQIHVSSGVVAASEIRQNFITAVKCWELLHASETLEKDLNRLFQHWKAENWTWLKNFEMDVLIYKGYFKEAVSVLHSSQGSNRNVSSVLRADLQLACCYYCLANFSKACEMILHIVSVLPSGAEPCARDIGVAGTGRQLQFLVCSAAEVLPYCIHLMITCFREKAFKTYAADDMSLGHMIVLLQYDWPRYEDQFGDCLNKIRKQGSFTYNIFFNYVINIDILEEFAYLKTPDGGKVNLDILPISTKTLAQSRTVTRGVIKGVKEDFKVTLEKQVARCNESIERVIRQFLVDERVILQQNLL